MALRRSVSCSRLLKQLLQLQLLQNSPFAKQSQYLKVRNKAQVLQTQLEAVLCAVRVNGVQWFSVRFTVNTITHSNTHSLRHCDLVQLQGFLGLGVVSVVDML